MLLEANEISSIYAISDKEKLWEKAVPAHVALIMDGNRRFAKQRGMPSPYGHWKGAEALIRLVPAAMELGIEIMTVYAFSTENWRRDPIEIRALLRLLKHTVIRELPQMMRAGVSLSFIGDLEAFPEDIIDVLTKSSDMTKNNTAFRLVLGLNYGGRDEMTRAFRKIAKECVEGRLSFEDIREETIASYLDTRGYDDPDLVIRTSGEHRLSNFLLWQTSYAEMIVVPVLWPDFHPNHLLNAVVEYQQREGRWGK